MDMKSEKIIPSVEGYDEKTRTMKKIENIPYGSGLTVYDKINELVDAITEIQEMLKKKEVSAKPRSIWDLKIEDDELYWRLNDSCGQISSNFFNDVEDEKARLIGNAFLTKEAAEIELEWRRNRAKECNQGLSK